jgi:hypothetical protein
MAVAVKRERRLQGKTTRTALQARPSDGWQRIAAKAYELYEQRGRRDGYALDDWLESEQMVNLELNEDE